MKHSLTIDAAILMVIGATGVGMGLLAPGDYSITLLLIVVTALSAASAILEINRRLKILESKADTKAPT